MGKPRLVFSTVGVRRELAAVANGREPTLLCRKKRQKKAEFKKSLCGKWEAKPPKILSEGSPRASLSAKKKEEGPNTWNAEGVRVTHYIAKIRLNRGSAKKNPH